jgi:hypothetical protein
LGSTSISAIVATFIPTFLTAVLFLAIFVAIRNKYRKIYTPRTYIGVVPEKFVSTLDPNQFIVANGSPETEHPSLAVDATIGSTALEPLMTSSSFAATH